MDVPTFGTAPFLGRVLRILILGALGLVSAAKAQTSIDHFDDGLVYVSSFGTPVTETVTATVAGGYRTVTVEALSAGLTSAQVDPVNLPGLLDVASNLPSSRTSLLYDANGDGLIFAGAGDFGQESAFELTMASLQLPDPGDELEVSILVVDETGNSGQVTHVFTSSFLTNTSVVYSFADYSPAVDFSRLDSIEVIFDTGIADGVDYQVDGIIAVPEP